MDGHASFGYWVRRRRKALDLTQLALARQVGCALSMIRKIEADERRPSRPMAERLATLLAIPAPDRDRFLQAARAQLSPERLPGPADRLPADTAPAHPATGALPASPTPLLGRTQSSAPNSPRCRRR